ncbi:MAG: HD domain-containing protein [Chromatiales bacterium]|nr:HD domain-containing protein [Chromatiales bacterium]
MAVDDEWLDDLCLRIDDLCAITSEYLEPEQVEQLREACYFAAEAHAGIYRKSGEPYIFHPLAVARILANVRFDHETLLAALLHDVIEDTHDSKEQISQPLRTGGRRSGRRRQQARPRSSSTPSWRRRPRTSARCCWRWRSDLRVIMIKLADRLHNMRTLGADAARNRAAASRARRWRSTRRSPTGWACTRSSARSWRTSASATATRCATRCSQDAVRKAHAATASEFVSQGIDDRAARTSSSSGEHRRRVIEGASKHALQHLPEDAAQEAPGVRARSLDVYGFRVRIIVDTADTCYRTLGVMHSLYKPIPGRFKDYIAIPKANGYQSLHTMLFGPNGMPDRGADPHRGHAPHGRSRASPRTGSYKSDGDGQDAHAQRRAREWLQQAARHAAPGRQSGGIPRKRQGRPVPRRGLRVHAQAARSCALPRGADRGGFRLRRAHRRRQHAASRPRSTAGWCRCARR